MAAKASAMSSEQQLWGPADEESERGMMGGTGGAAKARAGRAAGGGRRSIPSGAPNEIDGLMADGGRMRQKRAGSGE